MLVKVFVLFFIFSITTYVILMILRKEKQRRILQKESKQTMGTLVELQKYGSPKKGRGGIHYKAIFEYYHKSEVYTLDVLKYEFEGKFGDVENEWGTQKRISYSEHNPKIARLTSELNEPSTSNLEIIFILIVTIPLLIGILFTIF